MSMAEEVALSFENLSLGPVPAAFDAAADARSLGCNKTEFEEAAMNIFTSRTNLQMQRVASEFLKQIGSDLKAHVINETSGNLEKLLCALLVPYDYYDAEQMYLAMKGLGTNEDVLIEVLTSRTNAEIAAMKVAFQQKYGKTLEKWVESELGGDVRRALIALCKGAREEDSGSHDVAHADAQILYKAGEGKLGTDEKKFIEVLTKRSRAQNLATNHAYQQKYGKTLEEAIQKEVSGDFRKTMLALVNPDRFAASLVHKAIAGLGTDDTALIRLLARHSGDSIENMKKWYIKDFKTAMQTDIEGDTSGNYRKAMMRLACKTPAEYDALFLREAMRGLGTNDAVLIEILTHRTPAQRTGLAKAFKLDAGKSLKKSIGGDTSGHYGKFLQALAVPPASFAAKQLRKAMSGIGTKESVLIEILVTRTNTQIKEIKEAYERKYRGKTLESDIKGDTSGNFESALVKLLRCVRSTVPTISKQEAEKVAEDLYKGGEKRLGTNDELFVTTMTKYSPKQLQTISEAYERLTSHRLEKAIEKECSGDYKTMLIALIDPETYCAKLLKAATKGLGTDEDQLIRTLVSQSKTDMQPILQRYEQLFGASALDDIKADTSGDFQHALVAYLA